MNRDIDMKQFIILLATFILSSLASFGKDDVKRPESYNYVRGVEAIHNQNYREAYDYLLREIKENPKNGYAYCWIATIDQYNEDFGQGLSNCDMALKYIPKKDKVYLAFSHKLKAEIYKDLNEDGKALAEYDQAIKITPDDTDLRNARGNYNYFLNNYEAADADYRKIMEMEPSNPLGYLGVGRNLLALERYDDAIPMFDYAIKLNTSYGLPYSFRGQCYLMKNDWNKATDDLISALAADNDDKAFRLMQDLNGEAFDTFIAKLKIQSTKEPNEAKWMYYAGVMHEHNKKYKKAIEYYSKAMSKNAGSTIAERIANCYQDLGNFSEALAWTNRALNIDADDYDLVLLKADLLNDSGDVDGGIAELDKFIERYPEFYYGYYRRGFFKDNAQRIDEALEDYSFSIALNPEYAYAYFGRADMYKAKGDIQRANADYKKVIELDSIPGNNSCAQYAFFELGQREKAVEFMDSIISHDSDNPGNYYEAACLYSRMGIKEKALGYLMTALEKGYNRFAHILADDDLSLIRDTDTFRNLIKEYQTKRASENNSTESNEYVEEIVTVPFTKEGGVYKVKCSINDLPLHFIFDTGASSVSLSMVEANFMMKNDYLKPSDVIGSQHFVDANGDISEGTIINLSHVNLGGLELSNVRASVVRNQKAPLLLGQSVLSRLGKIEIDNENQQLKITHQIKK